MNAAEEDLSRLLAGGPSPLAFARLRAIIDLVPFSSEREALVEGIDNATSHWPPFAKTIEGPVELIRAAVQSPSWRLVQALSVSDPSEGNKIELIDLIRSSSAPSTLKELSFGVVDDDLLLVKLSKLAGSPKLSSLCFELGANISVSCLSRFLSSLNKLQFNTLQITATSYDENLHKILAAFFLKASDPIPQIGLGAIAADLVAWFLKNWARPIRDVGWLPLSSETIGLLATNRELTSSLEFLNFSGLHLEDHDAHAVFCNGNFTNLKTINLYANRLSDRGLMALVSSGVSSGLKQLTLDYNPVGDSGWVVLSRAPLETLEQLSLASTGASDSGAATLASSQLMGPLKSLDLSGNAITDEGFSVLLRSSLPADLRTCNFLGTLFGPPSAAELANSSSRPAQLSELAVGGELVDAECVKLLVRGEAFVSLKTLSLPWSSLGDQGLTLICQSAAFPSLNSLIVPNNRIGARGVEALAASPALRFLYNLNLAGNPIGDSGLAFLSVSKSLNKLVNLNLSNCAFSEDASRAFASCPASSLLEKIVLFPFQVGVQPWTNSPTLRPECRAYANHIESNL